MQVIKSAFFILVFFGLISHSAFSSNILQDAEAAFKMRGDSLEKLKKAKTLYKNVLFTKSKQSRDVYLKSFSHYARLSVLDGYLGRYLFSESSAEPEDIFEQCLAASDHVKKLKYHDSPEYLYWRASCLGMWLDQANSKPMGARKGIRALSRLREFKKLIAQGLKLYPEFEDMGFHRLKIGYLIAAKGNSLLGKWDPVEALRLVGELDEGVVNPRIKIHYLLMAQVYVELGRVDEANEILNAGKAALEQSFEQNENLDSLPENQAVLGQLEEFLASL